MNWLTGKGSVKVQAVEINSPVSGRPVPAVYMAWRLQWFHWKAVAVDIVSFLIIAEKMADHVLSGKEGAFHYVADHGDTTNPCLVDVTVPAWAVKKVAVRASVIAPLIYEGMKKADEQTEEAMEKLKAIVPPDSIAPLQGLSAMAQYRQLHARLNGYSPTEASKVVH